MECPYLEKGRVAMCGASITMMVPSIEEEKTWCSTEDHYRCPMLLGHVLRSGARKERVKRTA
jgi:hypothetical protein